MAQKLTQRQAVSLLKNLSFTINKQHLKVTPKPLIQIVNLSQFNFNTEQQSKQEGQNSSYSDQQWFNSGTQSQENTQQPPINDQNQNPNDTTNPPPLYDFQAPKDDSYKNFQSTKDFIRRYLILFPLAAYCFYELFFIRKNKFSRNREFTLFGKSFEYGVLGPLISRKISNSYPNLIQTI